MNIILMNNREKLSLHWELTQQLYLSHQHFAFVLLDAVASNWEKRLNTARFCLIQNNSETVSIVTAGPLLTLQGGWARLHRLGPNLYHDQHKKPEPETWSRSWSGAGPVMLRQREPANILCCCRPGTVLPHTSAGSAQLALVTLSLSCPSLRYIWNRLIISLIPECPCINPQAFRTSHKLQQDCLYMHVKTQLDITENHTGHE